MANANVKITVLNSGERVISQVGEATREIEGQVQFIGYIFTNPQIMEVDDTQVLTEEADSSISITLRPWINLSKDTQFLTIPQNIITMCDPIEDILNLYIEKVGVLEEDEVQQQLNPQES
tara:strand:+ start:199 stop:558 length:360 start_codon:yes stop_codon:yes gene_type:complete